MQLYVLTPRRICIAVVNVYLGDSIFFICHVFAIGSTTIRMLNMEQVAATLPGSAKLLQIQS